MMTAGIKGFAESTAALLVKDTPFLVKAMLAADHSEVLDRGMCSAFKAVCDAATDGQWRSHAEEAAVAMALHRLRRMLAAEFDSSDQNCAWVRFARC